MSGAHGILAGAKHTSSLPSESRPVRLAQWVGHIPRHDATKHKGPYLNDVYIEGGRKVKKNADVVREVAWI